MEGNSATVTRPRLDVFDAQYIVGRLHQVGDVRAYAFQSKGAGLGDGVALGEIVAEHKLHIARFALHKLRNVTEFLEFLCFGAEAQGEFPEHRQRFYRPFGKPLGGGYGVDRGQFYDEVGARLERPLSTGVLVGYAYIAALRETAAHNHDERVGFGLSARFFEHFEVPVVERIVLRDYGGDFQNRFLRFLAF